MGVFARWYLTTDFHQLFGGFFEFVEYLVNHHFVVHLIFIEIFAFSSSLIGLHYISHSFVLQKIFELAIVQIVPKAIGLHMESYLSFLIYLIHLGLFQQYQTWNLTIKSLKKIFQIKTHSPRLSAHVHSPGRQHLPRFFRFFISTGSSLDILFSF